MSYRTVEQGIRYRLKADGSRTYYVDCTRNGRRERVRVDGNLKDARAERDRLRTETAKAPEGVPIPGQRVRLGTFIERYTEDYLEIHAARSLQSEKNRLDLILAKLGNRPLSEITPADIQRFLSAKVREKRKPATVNRYRARLNSLFTKAVLWGYLERNPVQGTRTLPEQQKGDRYLEPKEVDKLAKVCGPELGPFVRFAALTGIRQGALLKMDWSDLDPDLAHVTLPGEITKSGQPRTVPLVSEARDILWAIGWKADGQVWPFVNFPRKRWEQAVKDAGWRDTDNPRLRGWQFHDLRHHAASMFAMAGMSAVEIARVLGHTQLQTTMRYMHLAPDQLGERMEAAMNGERARHIARHIPESGESGNDVEPH